MPEADRVSRRMSWVAALWLSAAAAGLAALPPGCSSSARPRAAAVPVVTRDIPSVLRNTVGSEVTTSLLQPQLISGYGLVVGLKGTGGGELPETVAATMERELAKNGIGSGSADFLGTPFEGLTPKEVLRSKNVAVVLITAAIAPASPKDSTFDVYVRALNSSGFVSLEGGWLWTADMVNGPVQTFGKPQARKLAIARGPIFINPFAEEQDGTDLTRGQGRILNGGRVTDPFAVELWMDNPSWRRAQAIQTSVNSRFPRRPGDEDDVVRGKSDRLLALRVPVAYALRAEEFMRLVLHVQIDQSFPQEYARRYTEALKAEPYLADDMAWCLQALPNRVALPFVRPLYDDPELAVRLAALRVGAGLDDPTAAPSLTDLARSGPLSARSEALTLLGKLQSSPKVDLALRDLLSSDLLDVRVGAYEALRARAERELLAMSRAAAPKVTAGAFEVGDRTSDPWEHIDFGRVSIQGVRTRPIFGASPIDVKFFLDVVPSGEPLIYVTQQGTPRVVLFGEGLRLNKPLYVEAWKGRLILSAETETDAVRLLYTPATPPGETPRTITNKDAAVPLEELIAYFAKVPTPENPAPGLSMSYSDIVGALYALQKGGGVTAYFATEEDRLAAKLLAAATDSANQVRPETLKQEQILKVDEPVTSLKPVPKDDKPDEPLVEPLTPTAPKQ